MRVSVMGADAGPGIIPGRQHLAAGREIRASGIGWIGWTVLRPTFDLTGPELLSTAEGLSVLSSVLGHRYTCIDVSEQAAREAMEKTGMPAWPADALLELNALIRQDHAATLTGGVQQVLGRPLRAMREWAAHLKTSPGTA